MEQSEFKKALAKYEARKKKVVANPDLKPETFKVNTALPFEPIYHAPAKKEKPKEAVRPAPKALELSITGPVEFKLTIDWSGTLMGGQMNQQTLKELFTQYLKPIGRVR